ncbi:MAG: TrmH family RNA methyltransferase, partial [Propionibacteriaceae bacterium]
MPQLITLTDSRDDRLRDYVSLRDTTLRSSIEEDEGIFIAEGEKVIRRALAVGLRPRSLLLAQRWLDSLSDLLAQYPELPVYVVTEALAEEVTGFHIHRGALGSFARQTRWTPAQLLELNRLVVCEDIVDHTN